MSSSTGTYKALRWLRIVVSLAVMIAIGWAVAAGYDLWLSRWQIIPALLAGAVQWLLLWFLVTALVGRIYCSTACPMGTLMDIFARLRHRRNGYFYSLPRNMLRLTIVFMAAVAALLGISVILGLFDPAAAYARIVVYLGMPLFGAVAFSAVAAIVAGLTVVTVAVVAWRRGRLLCNTLCPVGAVLGGLSKWSVFHIDINTDVCTGCGRCTAVCKAECIDPSPHTVDSTRCVVCFDCTAVCPTSAITLRRGRHQLQIPMLQTIEQGAAAFGEPEQPKADVKPMDRRAFFAALAAIPASALASAPQSYRVAPLNYVRPPGAESSEHYLAQCTACGMCTAVCPTGVLRPGGREFGLRNALHPVMDFDAGMCAYDCVKCTQICPTGALEPMTPAQKHRTPIGKARLQPDLCIEYTEGANCGICARRCPVGAISIVQAEGKTLSGKQRRVPRVDFDACIGCGACRHFCPDRPRAFVIEGI